MFKKYCLFLLAILSMSGCRKTDITSSNIYTHSGVINYTGKIYLYGESHGDERILSEEFNIWSEYYKSGMRDLFIEVSYFSAEFLNIWLKEKDDQILDQLFTDTKGAPGNTIYSYNFYKKIKEQCPDTIFHGTDIGHQYDSTGYRFIEYLKTNKLEETLKYDLAMKAIDQDKKYNSQAMDPIYRENKMVENFIREIKTVNNADIMGIYGRAHTGLKDLNFSNQIPNMANQLNTILTNQIYSEDLAKLQKPLREDIVILNNKEYKASYYGKHAVSLENYEYREYWLIHDAYKDFKWNNIINNYIPYVDYPMNIDLKNIYKIRYYSIDGTTSDFYYISKGKKINDLLVTYKISISK